MTRQTLHIERLGHGGDGIAEGPIYVPRILPGEVVEGEVEGRRMERPRIIEPSIHRVSPPCPHYRSCGGCALQHASDGFMADWKADVVRRALAARGLAADVGPVVVTSPPRSRRRATLAGRRTKGGAIVGFHGRASETLTAIPECRLLHPDLMAALPALEELTRIGASRKAEITLAITRTQNGPDVVVSGARPADPDMITDLGRLASAYRLARLSWNGEAVATLAPPSQMFGKTRVVPPPGGFLQATTEGEVALTEMVAEATSGAGRILDLFAGVGTFSLPLAKTAEVHAVEADREALAALDAAWRGAEGLKRVTNEPRDLFRRPLLGDDLAGFDAAVIDPPRSGAEAQARGLGESGPRRIVSVSCDPATFARDAEILVAGGYTMRPVTVVDQFRWSSHVEVVARFDRT